MGILGYLEKVKNPSLPLNSQGFPSCISIYFIGRDGNPRGAPWPTGRGFSIFFLSGKVEIHGRPGKWLPSISAQRGRFGAARWQTYLGGIAAQGQGFIACAHKIISGGCVEFGSRLIALAQPMFRIAVSRLKFPNRLRRRILGIRVVAWSRTHEARPAVREAQFAIRKAQSAPSRLACGKKSMGSRSQPPFPYYKTQRPKKLFSCLGFLVL